MTDDRTEATAVLWEQAKAEVEQQNADLDALRTRAIAMLSVATLVGGLFGTRLPHARHSNLNLVALVAALVLFAVSVILAVAIAWPTSWYFGAETRELTDMLAEGNATLAQVRLSLARRAEENWAENSGTLERRYRLFAALCAAVGLQVAAWALAVI